MLDREATDALTDEEALATIVPTPPPGLPTRIGRFHIRRELGRGGMGVVYEGYDARLDRRVAVKVVDLHRVDRRGRDRVRREARALARLSHPQVVQVFEVGEEPRLGDSTGGATLYLAMEHVEGLTLRQWRNAAPRRWTEVLAAYRQAAAGLAAAHDKGLVHRDFKPDNAIIGHDGRVRVLDFGLAREQDGDGPDDPEGVADERGIDVVTEDGTVLGTPAYMAPEQFLGERLDARTDQFALCVSLYEALYGQRPFEGQTRLALLDAVTKGRMRSLPDDREEPPWVLAALRRGLQPDPADRFPDLRTLLRALDPPRTRGRWLALGLAAVVGLGWGAWASTPSVAPCSDAAARWHAVWSPQRREAVARALGQAPVPYAEHARARVLDTLDAYGTAWIEEHTAACTASLGRAGASPTGLQRRMACLASGRRRFEALVGVLAQADANVVEHAVQAATELPPVARCAEPHSSAPGDELTNPERAREVEALRAELDVAIAWHDAGADAGALPRVRAVVEHAQALPHRPLLAEGRLWLGLVHDALGEPAAAVESHRAAFFDARAEGMDEIAARAATSLVFEEGYRLGRYAQADAWAEHARASLERLGDGALEPALHMAVGNVDVARGRYEAGRRGLQQAVDGFMAQLGPEHPQVVKALGNLATAEHYLGRFDAALALNEQVLALQRRLLGASHPAVALARANLGSALLMTGRLDEALSELQAALRADLATVGPRHPSVLYTRTNIAAAHWMRGDYARALEGQREVVALAVELHGDDDVEVASALSNMAGSLLQLGQAEDAAAALRQAVAILEQQLPADHPDLARDLYNLALVEHELGHPTAALEHGRRALEIREQRLPKLHHDRSASHMQLAAILEDIGELQAARDAAATALELREQGRTASVGELASARMQLARLTWLTGGDRAHARALAEGARDEFLAAGEEWRPQHDDAVAWLEQHPWP